LFVPGLFVPGLAGSRPDPLLPVVFFRIIARLRLDTRTQQILMPLVLFLPLVSLAIYLIPIWLLRRKAYARAQDYFVSSEHTPPGVIRNSSVGYALKMATFGPFFVWGASADFWPAIIYSTFFALGVWLIYIVRRPMLAFMQSALHGDRSITVHDFIARQHGNDPRVRLFASCLTVLAIFALVIGEALVVATFLKPVLSGDAAATSVFVCGLLALMALYAMLSGNSGVMRSAQSQLGMLYLGLFGATALLLYLLISAQRPMSPHSTFAMVFVAACCAVMPFYRRSVYVDTSPIRTANSNADRSGRESPGGRLFRRFEKILNACISVCAAWVIVLVAMQLYSDGLPAIARESAAALQTGTRLSGIGLVALLLLPLFHPVVDMTNWQRLAAFEKDASDIEPSQRPAIVRGILRIYAIETPLMSLFMCMFGVVAAVAMATPGGADAIAAFIRELAAEENAMAGAALALLLVSVFAIALSTMSSLFSASLCTVRYDVLPAFWPERAPAAAQTGEGTPTGEGTTRRLVMAGGGLYLVMIVAGFLIADAYLQISFASSEFLALLFAFYCAQLSFVPLVLAPVMGGTVSARWALVILGVSAVMGLLAVTIYVATRNESWLWAAVPACLGSGFLLFATARRRPGKPPAAA
jgi:hypothetical protein